MAKRTSYAKANSPIQRLTYQQIHSIFTQERERERERAKARRPYAESKIIFSLRTGFFATSTGKPLLGALRSDLQSVRLPKSLVSFGDCWIQIFASNNLTHTVR